MFLVEQGGPSGGNCSEVDTFGKRPYVDHETQVEAAADQEMIHFFDQYGHMPSADEFVAFLQAERTNSPQPVQELEVRQATPADFVGRLAVATA